MNLIIIFRGPLAITLGNEKIEYKGEEKSIIEIIKKLDNNKGILYDYKSKNVKSGYIILINGKDYRLLEDNKIKDGDIIEIIPINHGG
jgi:molybdopterin converting factor small subunit